MLQHVRPMISVSSHFEVVLFRMLTPSGVFNWLVQVKCVWKLEILNVMQ